MAERHPERSEGSPKIRLLITIGDPSGIGPEVLLKSLATLRRAVHPELGRRMNGLLRVNVTVIGDIPLLKSLAKRLKLKIPWSQFNWVDLPGPGGGPASYRYLQEAVRLLKNGEADAVVTGPVSKESIAKAGIRWRGHTEYLAEQFRRRTTMMFVTGAFRASLVTTHWAIREVPPKLRAADVRRVIADTRDALVRDFGIRRPRIGVAALNPHGGEGGLFGAEEKKILLPAVRASTRSARTVRIEGPLPSDSLIQAAVRGKYDAVVAIYHDQALIPVKLLGWESAVNVTLGLPFVRTSPVHGTAFDIAGKGRADPSSMKAAIDLAIRLAKGRK